jgi:hypothetical protein
MEGRADDKEGAAPDEEIGLCNAGARARARRSQRRLCARTAVRRLLS